ncbi:hypothetical protein [Mucilaginibacter xinganensis]|uniref:DUF3575 domain-containing protein n=1 Tax=Mucilaginibacter xinganensis TaxID=1234841 RepID=A0A223P1X6_9SPHI|nr:hypothetical protein [Mucilaginibacter xinganensis]ASU35944.1 hypothetical protein MuYL_4059 [Mucilaginibacter xinganensis]
MKKLLVCSFILASFLLISSRSNAQEYKTAVGLKFGGYENGISAKYFTTNDVALEGLLGFRSHGVVITGLYEIHQEAFGVKELKFYYGAGAHIGAIGSGLYRRFNGDDQYYNNSHILLGVDGVLGLEYVIPQSPIAVSLDLNPRAELATGPFFDIAPGLGIKYTF